MIKTRGELDALPMFSKLRAVDGELYEKLPTGNAAGVGWFAPGSTRAYSAAVIELPALVL